MKKSIRWVGGVAVAGLLLAAGYAAVEAFRPAGDEPGEPVSGAPASLQTPVARGEYLARAADCIACHSTTGGKELAGGVAFNLPFGVIYSTNITADRETGIGSWTDDEFVRAVRQGVSPRGHLYPAMPYTSYTQLSRNDILAIKAYLFSRESVKQANTSNKLSFPFNQRWAIALWNIAFFREHRTPVSEAKSSDWNRGAYLATALGHCAECHTPRNFAYGLSRARTLSGGDIQGWLAPNITNDPATGIGRWTDSQLMDYFSTGHAAGRSSASGPMGEVVEHSLQYLTNSDLHALIAYLRTVSPVRTEQGSAVNLQAESATASSAAVPASSAMLAGDHGAMLFASDCAGCHQWNGKGRQSVYASLVGSTAVNDLRGRNVIQVVLRGTQIKIGPNEEVMPGFGGRYSDADVAAVTNFVLKHFGEKDGAVTEGDVRLRRRN